MVAVRRDLSPLPALVRRRRRPSGWPSSPPPPVEERGYPVSDYCCVDPPLDTFWLVVSLREGPIPVAAGPPRRRPPTTTSPSTLLQFRSTLRAASRASLVSNSFEDFNFSRTAPVQTIACADRFYEATQCRWARHVWEVYPHLPGLFSTCPLRFARDTTLKDRLRQLLRH